MDSKACQKNNFEKFYNNVTGHEMGGVVESAWITLQEKKIDDQVNQQEQDQKEPRNGHYELFCQRRAKRYSHWILSIVNVVKIGKRIGAVS